MVTNSSGDLMVPLAEHSRVVRFHVERCQRLVALAAVGGFAAGGLFIVFLLRAMHVWSS